MKSDKFNNCKAIYLVREDGLKQGSLEYLFSLFVEGNMYRFCPLSPAWTYYANGIPAPAMEKGDSYNLFFLGNSKMLDTSLVDSRTTFAKFLYNSKVLWIPIGEIIRCNIYEYEF